ncbi:MAG TPA: ankyrin repeat domain-containing protein, partial [Polyangiaceae bacterium]|nr:ankyrin repeat domain-containing protein [Polyangiaceae bacterium]
MEMMTRFASRSLLFSALSAVALAGALTVAACDKKEAAQSEATAVDVKAIFTDPTAAQLAEAAAAGDSAKIASLVQGGANPSAIGDKGTSLLQWAMLNKNKAGMEALLTAGADTSHTDESGDTIMLYAAKANDPAYLDILLAHKVDVVTPNPVSGMTPLIASIFGERDVQFHKLIAAGANVNQADRFGNTPLHMA